MCVYSVLVESVGGAGRAQCVGVSYRRGCAESSLSGGIVLVREMKWFDDATTRV